MKFDEQKDNSAQDETGAFFRGTVNKINFRSESSGFGVMRAEAASGQGFSEPTATVVGLIPPDLSPGANFIARGEWQTHPKFGKQFRARSITEAAPTGREALIRYLGSGAIKGFGPVLAERVVERFGEETLEILDKQTDRLREVSGIGEQKLQEIKLAWQVKRNVRDVLLFFQNHDISLNLAQRIYDQYGERAIETVKTNPYVLSRDMWGVGFKTADKIALAIGLAPDSLERVEAGMIHVLKRASDDGHCFLPRDTLLTKTQSLLDLSDGEALENALARAINNNLITADREKIYLPYIFQAESEVARIIRERTAPGVLPDISIPQELINAACNVTHLDERVQPPRMIKLSDEQQQAIKIAAESLMLVITGGPGCGKTTVVRTISQLFRRAGLRIKLAAPTGRAAQRLAEVCNFEASTIHRLLKFDPIDRGFLHDQNDPLPLDVLILDEASMIDIQLASAVLRAIPKGARVIIVGDADQLPSVGAGRFLAELNEIPALPCVRLTRLFRREEESAITVIAHKINAGLIPDIPEPDGQTKSDAYFLPAKDITEAAELIERLVVEQIPKRFGFKGAEMMVLSPMNQGDLGIISLNQRLQARLVPARPGLPTLRSGDIEFRLGDRVIQRVNNYNLHEAGVFNGDQGEVIGIDSGSGRLNVRLWDGREIDYPSSSVGQLDLAYALTVHRAQGSEVPAVVLVLHDTHNIMLERQLVYTGITRAKKLLILVGTKKALILAAKRTRSTRRYTALAERILAA